MRHAPQLELGAVDAELIAEAYCRARRRGRSCSSTAAAKHRRRRETGAQGDRAQAIHRVRRRVSRPHAVRDSRCRAPRRCTGMPTSRFSRPCAPTYPPCSCAALRRLSICTRRLLRRMVWSAAGVGQAARSPPSSSRPNRAKAAIMPMAPVAAQRIRATDAQARHLTDRRRDPVRLGPDGQMVRLRASGHRAGHGRLRQSGRRRAAAGGRGRAAGLMEKWQPGEHGTTFGGNPLSCAAGLAALQDHRARGIGRARGASGRDDQGPL